MMVHGPYPVHGMDTDGGGDARLFSQGTQKMLTLLSFVATACALLPLPGAATTAGAASRRQDCMSFCCSTPSTFIFTKFSMRYLKVFQYPKSGCRSKIWQSTRQLLGAADPAFAISIGSARQLLLGAQLLESQVSLNHAGTVDHVAGTRLCPTGPPPN